MEGMNGNRANVNGKQTTNNNSDKSLKITAVGDGMVGKTCLLFTYVNKEFPGAYVPTVFDNYPGEITADGVDYDVVIWDTAGQEDYQRLRPLSYPHTKCFLLCFAINSNSSYENVFSKWYPELKQFCPNVPIILVGTKADLRDNDANDVGEVNLLPSSYGKKMQRRIKAVKYMECSALKYEGLDEIFIEAVRAATKKQPTKTRSCILL